MTDDNETGGNLDKRSIWLIGVGHTSVPSGQTQKSKALDPTRRNTRNPFWVLQKQRFWKAKKLSNIDVLRKWETIERKWLKLYRYRDVEPIFRKPGRADGGNEFSDTL